MVPCAQGRVITETARPAPPHFATCSTYRRSLIVEKSSVAANNVNVIDDTLALKLASAVSTALGTTIITETGTGTGTGTGTTMTMTMAMTMATASASVATMAIPWSDEQWQLSRLDTREMTNALENATTAQNLATRPEDLGVTPRCYNKDSREKSEQNVRWTGPDDRGSFPSYSHAGKEQAFDRPEANSTRSSSVESSENSRARQSGVYRKAYMDLRDAIALLDETCPNPDAGPSVTTPKTPRTPLTPHPRSKRARSKSSDNSFNYSTERLSDKSLDTFKISEKEKKRPFLKKIGLSRTEDKPLLARFAPKIIGKPYLQKIGPSKAMERPFLHKIGSSRTLDPPSPVIFAFHPERDIDESNKNHSKTTTIKDVRREVNYVSDGNKHCGKGFLLKMYSFETEDLEEAPRPTNVSHDPLRGESAEEVLNSGPSSLPTNVNEEEEGDRQIQQSTLSVAELLKCRVTTSEEIISSTTYADEVTSRRGNSWANSPTREFNCKPKGHNIQGPKSPSRRRRNVPFLAATWHSDEGTWNSAVKGHATTSGMPRDTLAPKLTLKRLDRNEQSSGVKQLQLEKRGISSDNLLSRSNVASMGSMAGAASNVTTDTQQTLSENSLYRPSSLERANINKNVSLKDDENLEVLCQVPDETYAAFKRRTRRYLCTIDRLSRAAAAATAAYPSRSSSSSSSFATEFGKDLRDRLGEVAIHANDERKSLGQRSMLKKQDGMDQPGDQEADVNASLTQKPMLHEPSQETIDLLAELCETKSLLKSEMCENVKDEELEKNVGRLPKRILLTDKEFCLSIERENSVRKASRSINVSIFDKNSAHKTEENECLSEEKKTQRHTVCPLTESMQIPIPPIGPALFEKRCLSLDYADEEKSQRSEIRAVSLTSAKNLPSQSDGTIASTDFTLLCDSNGKSCTSNVFRASSDEMSHKLVIIQEKKTHNSEATTLSHANNKFNDNDEEEDKKNDGEEGEGEKKGINVGDIKNIECVGSRKEALGVISWMQEQMDVEPLKISGCHGYSEVDIAIPIEQKGDDGPSRRVQMQGRTSDLYEILSPRSTRFRVKKRLGKISVEETVKTESFTLASKLDCRAITVQKRTKCFPL